MTTVTLLLTYQIDSVVVFIMPLIDYSSTVGFSKCAIVNLKGKFTY